MRLTAQLRSPGCRSYPRAEQCRQLCRRMQTRHWTNLQASVGSQREWGWESLGRRSRRGWEDPCVQVPQGAPPV